MPSLRNQALNYLWDRLCPSFDRRSYLFLDERDGWTNVTIDRDGAYQDYFHRGRFAGHLNHNRSYGIRSGGETAYVDIDVDLHTSATAERLPGQIDLFLLKVEAILREFEARGLSYAITVPRSRLVEHGVGILSFFEQPRKTEEVQAEFRQMLEEIANEFPDLGVLAETVGAERIEGTELYPQIGGNGRRLFGAVNYGLMLDDSGPLPDVPFKGKWKWERKVFDVESLAGWLKSPDRKSPTIDAVIGHLKSQLPITSEPWRLKDLARVTSSPKRKRGRPKKQTTPTATPRRKRGRPKKSETVEASKRSKGWWERLTDFWTGKDNPSRKLNVYLIVSARVLHGEGIEQEQARQLLHSWIASLPDHARGCSGRLMRNDQDAIAKQINHVIKRAWRDGVSDKLRNSVAAWASSGRYLSKRETWHIRVRAVYELPSIPDFKFIKEDENAIKESLANVLSDKERKLAVKVAREIVILVFDKFRTKDGISYEYRREFLTRLGIACQNDLKLKDIFDALTLLDLIRVDQKPCKGFGKRPGKATVFALAARALKYHQILAQGFVGCPVEPKLFSETELQEAVRQGVLRQVAEDEVFRDEEREAREREDQTQSDYLAAQLTIAAFRLEIALNAHRLAAAAGHDLKEANHAVKRAMSAHLRRAEQFTKHQIRAFEREEAYYRALTSRTEAELETVQKLAAIKQARLDEKWLDTDDDSPGEWQE